MRWARYFRFMILVMGVGFLNDANAQIFSEDFNACSNLPGCGGSVDCWSSSHGTPSITAGNAVLLNGAGNDYGEGMFTNFTFVDGEKYTIVYDAAAPDDGVINIRAATYLLHDPFNPGDPCFGKEKPTTGTDEIDSRSLTAAWSTYTVSYEPGVTNGQIWVYGSVGVCYFDNLKIFDCVGNLIYNNADVLPKGLTEVSNSIHAGSEEDGGNALLKVESPPIDLVELKAGNHILFSSTFAACPTVGMLLAHIGPCNPSQLEPWLDDEKPLLVEETSVKPWHQNDLVVLSQSWSGSILQVTLVEDELISVTILNSIGQQVHTTGDRKRYAAGSHEIQVPTQNFENGVYVAVVDLGHKIMTEKFVISQ